MSMPVFLLAQDMADAGVRAGLPARTGSAIRQAVYAGRIKPTGMTPRGVHIWTVEDAQREIERLVKAQEMKNEALKLGRAHAENEGGR